MDPVVTALLIVSAFVLFVAGLFGWELVFRPKLMWLLPDECPFCGDDCFIQSGRSGRAFSCGTRVRIGFGWRIALRITRGPRCPGERTEAML